MSNYNIQDGINLNGDPKSDTIDFEVDMKDDFHDIILTSRTSGNYKST